MLEELAEPLLVEILDSEVLAIKPAAQPGYEAKVVVRRAARVTLLRELGCERVDVGGQRADTVLARDAGLGEE